MRVHVVMLIVLNTATIILLLSLPFDFDKEISARYACFLPVTVTARSEASTVFARLNAGIVGSNPARGIDVCTSCVYSVFVLFCVYVAVLRWADAPSKESYRLCIGSRNWKSGRGPTKGCRAIIIIIIIIIIHPSCSTYLIIPDFVTLIIIGVMVTVAARSKAWIVFGRWDREFESSQGTDVLFVYVFILWLGCPVCR
jgi:hypothetical protein